MPHSKLLTSLAAPILFLTATAALAQATQGGESVSSSGAPAPCNDPALGPVDCVPATFDTFDIPFDKLPGGRMDKNGNLDKDGGLPCNTHGGQLSEAYIHGMNGVNEGVRLIRGESLNQPSKNDHVLVTAGVGVPTSGMILGQL